MRTQKQWTLVTGGAKGLGAKICETLAEEGLSLLIHYHTSSQEAFAIRDLCRQKGRNAECVQGDFSSSESVDLFIEKLSAKFPHIENLINCVGNYRVQAPLVTSNAEWLELFQTNLHAPIALIRALLPSLKEHQGSITHIGVAGINHVPADIYSTAFTASKLALWMTTRALAKEFAPMGVRINMVSPGMLENTIDKPKDPNMLPMQRLGTLSEVARVVAFLISKESSYITGQNIEVAGGVRLI
ncbi:MAG: SDR family oxidoreductase [Parachlamydiaceae bacterium]|nr:SDR family oxidoreductase [Parachlamydiaceae bacterium]